MPRLAVAAAAASAPVDKKRVAVLQKLVAANQHQHQHQRRTSSEHLNYPWAVSILADGRYMVAEENNRVMVVDPVAKTVAHVAGRGQRGFVDGRGKSAAFSTPIGISTAPCGTAVLIADDCNQAVRKVSAAGEVTTLCGRPFSAALVEATVNDAVGNHFPDGVPLRAEPLETMHIAGAAARRAAAAAAATNRTIHAAETLQTRLRAQLNAPVDGPGDLARFQSIYAIACYHDGSAVVTENAAETATVSSINGRGCRVRSVAMQAADPGGAAAAGAARIYGPGDRAPTSRGAAATHTHTHTHTHTRRGSSTASTASSSASGSGGTGDGGAAGLVPDAVGSEARQHVVRTVVGAVGDGFADGDAKTARFSNVMGVCILPNGSTVVADATRLREIHPDNNVTTLAGSGAYGSLDGEDGLLSARFNRAESVAADSSGRVVVADASECLNFTVIRILSAGTCTTLQMVNERGIAAKLPEFTRIAIDADGNLVCVNEHGVYLITNTGLSPGYNAWMRVVWQPTRACRRLCSKHAVDAVWTMLLIMVRARAVVDAGDGHGSALSALPLLPIELWHCILQRLQLWELGAPSKRADAAAAGGGGGGGGGPSLAVLERAEAGKLKAAAERLQEENATLKGVVADLAAELAVLRANDGAALC